MTARGKFIDFVICANLGTADHQDIWLLSQLRIRFPFYLYTQQDHLEHIVMQVT
jgi:hypothetical protein